MRKETIFVQLNLIKLFAMNKKYKMQENEMEINPEKNSEMKSKKILNDEYDEDFIQHQEKVYNLLKRLKETKSTIH